MKGFGKYFDANWWRLPRGHEKRMHVIENVDEYRSVLSDIFMTAQYTYTNRKAEPVKFKDCPQSWATPIETDGHCEAIRFTYGRKEMEILLDDFIQLDELRTSISTKHDATKKDRKPNETTLLYLAAKALMQEITNQVGRDIKYCMGTGDETLMKWIECYGKEIFDLVDVDSEDFECYEMTFTPDPDSNPIEWWEE